VKRGILETYRERIEGGLSHALQGDAPLRSLLRYHVGLEDENGSAARATGKLLRPSLVLFIADQLDGDLEAALASAVGLELIHGFSLIHDDIQDQDRLRRGRPAVWTICGIEQAINAGDLMHALAISSALRSSPSAADCLIRATQEMIEGQSHDLEFERRDVTSTEYLAMIDRKTGALLRCAFELGGIAAGVNSDVRTTLTELGQAVGRAFQIQDDLLGIWGVDDVLGKATGSDIRRRKKSLPIVLLFERASGDDAATLSRLYRDGGSNDIAAEDVAWVVDRLDALDIRASCEETIRRHHTAALDRLADLPFTDEACGRLRELVEFLARRET
jgi:geranylgeranyl diphosphate synthase type I